MKRFQFGLETVLNYKQRALELLLIEYGSILEQVGRQTALWEQASAREREYNTEYARKQAEGLSILETLEYRRCAQVLERQTEREQEALKLLRQQAEAKRLQVVEGRKGAFSLERLREIRREEHADAERKEEEAFIDDLAAAKRAAGS